MIMTTESTEHTHKLNNLKYQVFRARQTSFGELGLINDPHKNFNIKYPGMGSVITKDQKNNLHYLYKILL